MERACGAYIPASEAGGATQADISELGAGVIPPFGQGAHVRFVDAVPFMATYWLVVQSVQSMHMVAPVLGL